MDTLAPDMQLVEQRIKVLMATLDRYTLYELLEVPTGAPPRVVARNCNLLLMAYRELMSRQDCTQQLQQSIYRVCHRLEQACKVLCDEDHRVTYDRQVEPVTIVERLHPLPRHLTGEILITGADHRPTPGMPDDDEEPTVTDFFPLKHILGPTVPRPEPALDSTPPLHGPGEEERSVPTVPNPKMQRIPPADDASFEELGDTLVDGPLNLRRDGTTHKTEGWAQLTTRQYARQRRKTHLDKPRRK